MHKILRRVPRFIIIGSLFLILSEPAKSIESTQTISKVSGKINSVRFNRWRKGTDRVAPPRAEWSANVQVNIPNIRSVSPKMHIDFLAEDDKGSLYKNCGSVYISKEGMFKEIDSKLIPKMLSWTFISGEIGGLGYNASKTRILAIHAVLSLNKEVLDEYVNQNANTLISKNIPTNWWAVTIK